jgi:hypothetical protein
VSTVGNANGADFTGSGGGTVALPTEGEASSTARTFGGASDFPHDTIAISTAILMARGYYVADAALLLGKVSSRARGDAVRRHRVGDALHLRQHVGRALIEEL